MRCIGETGSCDCCLSMLNDIIIGYDFEIDANDNVITTFARERCGNVATPFFQYKEYVFAWGGAYLKNRSWCSSSNANDQRAVTIECVSDALEPYAFRDVMYKKLIELCIDICKRNGKNNLIWFGDKDKTPNYSPKSGEMILTVHRWFANKSCPEELG